MMPEFATLQHLLEKYFPGEVSEEKMGQYKAAFEAYVTWNQSINVISRKDIEHLAERHFLHSLAIAKSIRFQPGTRVLDAGTGGGFPGIPLAIFFPETDFVLVDSREKKIKVVQEVAQAAGLKNVQSSVQRVEHLRDEFDFVVSRAVAALADFIPWVQHLIHCQSWHPLQNGILYLRGGDIEAEVKALPMLRPRWQQFELSQVFEEEFFQSKLLVHLTYCKEKKARPNP